MSLPLFGLAALCASLPLHDACLRRTKFSPAACERWRHTLTFLVFVIGIYGAWCAARFDSFLAHVVVTLLACSLLVVVRKKSDSRCSKPYLNWCAPGHPGAGNTEGCQGPCYQPTRTFPDT